MIYYLKGKVTYKDDKSLILENQGIGFKIFCSNKALENFKIGEEFKIYTFLYLREEKVELYGFSNPEELELFKTINGISGIGPKTALDLSSFGSLENLKKKMEEEEFHRGIKGIGKKKMQKILLELTGKIKEISKRERTEQDEVLDALVSLGFSRKMAETVLRRLPKEIKDSEERIKAALKMLGKEPR